MELQNVLQLCHDLGVEAIAVNIMYLLQKMSKILKIKY